MTVYVAFKPAADAPFQFQATFDGNPYTVIVTWNLFGQRWYVNVYDPTQTLIVALPMIGSPLSVKGVPSYNISLTAGYFTTQLVWRVETGNFEVIG